MIRNCDRSGWFGASDTARIMGRWDTVTFARWWAEKLGIIQNTYTSISMQTGTALEHRILDALGVRKRDRQIRIRPIRLRVNLDGETDVVHEVKTYAGEKFKVSCAHWMQCQVEAFAARKPVEIVAYRLEEEDYINWFRPIDDARLSRHPIDYDAVWIQEKYLPRLRYLAACLRKGAWPREKPD